MKFADLARIPKVECVKFSREQDAKYVQFQLLQAALRHEDVTKIDRKEGIRLALELREREVQQEEIHRQFEWIQYMIDMKPVHRSVLAEAKHTIPILKRELRSLKGKLSHVDAKQEELYHSLVKRQCEVQTELEYNEALIIEVTGLARELAQSVSDLESGNLSHFYHVRNEIHRLNALLKARVVPKVTSAGTFEKLAEKIERHFQFKVDEANRAKARDEEDKGRLEVEARSRLEREDAKWH